MVLETVSASEFRQNFGKYLALVELQDFQITKNGKVVALWSNPNRERLALSEKLAGCVHASIDLEADRAERRNRL